MYQPDRDKKAIMPPPVVNDVVSPKLRRDAAMFAPITNHFSPDAAAGKLVRSRLVQSGQPMPNQMHPMAQRVPSAADPAMPPPAARITPAMPPPAAKLSRAPGPGMLANMENNAPIFGAYAANRFRSDPNGNMAGNLLRKGVGVVAAVPAVAENVIRNGVVPAAQYAGSALQTAFGNSAPVNQAQAATPQPAAAPLAASPMPSGARRRGGISPNYTSNNGILSTPPTGVQQSPATPAAPPSGAPSSTVIEYTGDGKSGNANAAAPGQVALSERTQQPLPGKPLVGADGSVQYDQAFVTRNPQLMSQYAAQNVVQSVVPPAGVAQSMATGGQMQAGALSRPARGFTQEDRAAQLDGLDRLARGYTDTVMRTALKRAALSGDWDGVNALSGASYGLKSVPTAPAMEQMALNKRKQDADIGQQNAKLAMDQEKARLDAEQSGIQTQAQQLQLQQAQQMQALSEQLMQGTPEQKQAAAKYFAALPGNKQGEPFTIDAEIPGVGPMAPPIKIQRRFDASGQRLDQPTAYEMNYEAAMRHAALAKTPEQVDAIWANYRKNIGAMEEQR